METPSGDTLKIPFELFYGEYYKQHVRINPKLNPSFMVREEVLFFKAFLDNLKNKTNRINHIQEIKRQLFAYEVK